MASKNYITKRQATVLCNYIERYADANHKLQDCYGPDVDEAYNNAKNDMLAYIIGITKGDIFDKPKVKEDV